MGLADNHTSKSHISGGVRIEGSDRLEKKQAEAYIVNTQSTNRYSEAQKRKWRDPEYRAKVVDSIKKKWQDEDYRQRVSKALKVDSPLESANKVELCSRNKVKHSESYFLFHWSMIVLWLT